jgi:FKBP-type peptidyl-prolyl cis-trans isomerase (trigger factor)
MSEENNKYTNLKIDKESEKLVITAEVPAETLEKHKKDVLEEAQKDFEKEGFRKGNVPLDMVEEEIGQDKLMGEVVNKALNDAYPEIVKEKELKVMSSPKVSITKFAPGDSLGFKAEVAVVPEFDLPEYKKIGEKVMEEADNEELEVSDEEASQIINQILQMRTEAQKKEEGEKGKDGEKETKVPELTDEYVKTLGKFENVEDFKNKVKENLKQEKEMGRKRENREKIADGLVKETDMKIPEVALENELLSVKQRLQEDLKNKGMTMDEYMEKAGTTEEEFLKEQRNHIERQLKTKIILEKIAEEERIKPDEKQVELQAQMLASRYPNTDQDTLKNYVRMMIKNEKVLELLEGGDKDNSDNSDN